MPARGEGIGSVRPEGAAGGLGMRAAGLRAAGLRAWARAVAPRLGAVLRRGLMRLPGIFKDLLVGGLADLPAAMERARLDLVLWAPVALGLGIGVYFLLPLEPGAMARAAMAVGALVAAAVWARGGAAVRFPAALVALALIGLSLAAWRAHAVAAPVLGFRYYGPVEGRVVEIDRSARDQIRLTLDRVTLSNMDPERVPARVRVSLSWGADQLPEPGTRVMLTANLSPPPGPAEPRGFDFRRYAWFEGLGAVGYTRTPVLRAAPPDPDDPLMAGHRLRMRLSAAMQARMPGQAGAVASALMTGDRSGISEATNAAMRAANLYHIVSISGLHMGMLAGFVFGAIRYGLAALGGVALVWPVKKIAAVVALVAATIYLWVAGAEVATERAWIMVAVMLIGVLFDRRAISLRSVALAAAAILVWQPETVISAGFQMSFAATVALILVAGPWTRAARHLPSLVRPVAMLAATSLVAGFATGPIAAAQFHRMSEYGLLANMLAVPVMGALVMPAGVVAALLAPLGMAAPALWVMRIGTEWMLWVADFVAGLEGASVPVMAPPGWVLPLMALGALAAVLARGAGRGLGLAALAVAALGWQMASRPPILIAEGGTLVGVMTPAGRVQSKPGQAFVAESWLEADGDGAGVEAAAARAGFDGPRGARAGIFDGRRIVHLSGKAAPGAPLVEACRGGALVVLAARAPTGDWSGCDLWDEARLARTGAVALWPDGRLVTAAGVKGLRPWTAPDRGR